jgi:hypothetical protein
MRYRIAIGLKHWTPAEADRALRAVLLVDEAETLQITGMTAIFYSYSPMFFLERIAHEHGGDYMRWLNISEEK